MNEKQNTQPNWPAIHWWDYIVENGKKLLSLGIVRLSRVEIAFLDMW